MLLPTEHGYCKSQQELSVLQLPISFEWSNAVKFPANTLSLARNSTYVMQWKTKLFALRRNDIDWISSLFIALPYTCVIISNYMHAILELSSVGKQRERIQGPNIMSFFGGVFTLWRGIQSPYSKPRWQNWRSEEEGFIFQFVWNKEISWLYADLFYWGARKVMDIVVGNGFGETSSNLGWGCLHFT